MDLVEGSAVTNGSSVEVTKDSLVTTGPSAGVEVEEAWLVARGSPVEVEIEKE